LKVCLVGHFVEHPDEGVRNVTKYFAYGLEHHGIKVKKINISSPLYWRKLKTFNPDIIHYILSPTLIGFVSTKFISAMQPKAKSIVSAIHPCIPNWKFLSIFRPDKVLVQSYESERSFRLIGCKTNFLPNGVDTVKFKPANSITKEMLRKKYRIPYDKFVILHVASLKKERNLRVFVKLQQHIDNNKVIIIGRPKEKKDEKIFKELKNAGCTVWNQYFPNLEEIYALADCYVFPTINRRACIEIPLSVLEAMSCNLPVISTKFGALPRMFESGNGLFFVEKEEDIHQAIEIIKNENVQVETRKKVLPYTWKNVCKKLEEIYKELLQQVIIKKTIFICFLGTDGSGKSTLSKYLFDELLKKGYNVSYTWWLEGENFFLKKILKKFKKPPINNSIDKTTKKPKFLFINFFKMLYPKLILINYFLFGIKKAWFQKITHRKKIVIFDRYIYDIILAMTKEFNYSNSKKIKWLKLYGKLLPSPELIFIVDVPPKIAYSRKKEEIKSMENAKTTWQEYERLYLLLNNLVSGKIQRIDNTHELEKVKTKILKDVLDFSKKFINKNSMVKR